MNIISIQNLSFEIIYPLYMLRNSIIKEQLEWELSTAYVLCSTNYGGDYIIMVGLE